MQFDREGALRIVRAQIGRGDKHPAQKRPRIVLPLEMFAHFVGQRAFGAVDDHFYGVDEVFALRAQLPQAFGLRHFFELDLAGDLGSLRFELIQQRALVLKRGQPLGP